MPNSFTFSIDGCQDIQGPEMLKALKCCKPKSLRENPGSRTQSAKEMRSNTTQNHTRVSEQTKKKGNEKARPLLQRLAEGRGPQLESHLFLKGDLDSLRLDWLKQDIYSCAIVT